MNLKTFKGFAAIIPILRYYAACNQNKGIIIADSVMEYLNGQELNIDLDKWPKLSEKQRVDYVLNELGLEIFLLEDTDSHYECIPSKFIDDVMKSLIEGRREGDTPKEIKEESPTPKPRKRGRPKKGE